MHSWSLVSALHFIQITYRIVHLRLRQHSQGAQEDSLRRMQLRLRDIA